MNIDIDSERFASEFSQAAAFAHARSPKEVLQNIHVVVNGDGLFLHATDGDHSIRIESSALIEQHQDGQLLIPIDRGGRMLRELSGQASITVNGKSARVKGDGCSFNFPTADPDEFPRVTFDHAESYVEIAAAAFVRMVKETAYVCDDSSSRYALGGVTFESVGSLLTLVSTDGRRLSKSEHHCGVEGDSALPIGTTIVPKKAIQTVSRVLSKSDSIVRLSAPRSRLDIACGPACISIRLIEGRFPNWRQIEQNKVDGFRTAITADDLHTAVRRAAIVTSSESKAIDFEFSSHGLSITGRAESAGESVSSTDLLWETDTVVLSLDNTYVSEFCRSIDPNTEITVEVSGPNAPVYFGCDNGLSHMIQCMVRND